MAAEEEEYAFGPFRLDAVREQLWRGNEEIRLAPKVFAVLRYLVEHRGQIVSKNALLDSIWPDLHVTDTVLAVHVGKAREALADDPKKPAFIETVHRRGYRFIAVCTAGPQTPVADGALGDQPSRPAASEPATTLGAKPLVGRETELSLLREQLEAAIGGRGSLVFITGPAGIGKTRLTLEVRDWASTSGYQWLDGRYDKVVRHPYQAWVEMIRRHLQLSSSRSSDNLTASYGGQLSKLVPEIDTTEIPSETSRSDPEAERLKLFDAMTGFFLGIADESPLVLCINDLHWAGSIELVHYFARRIGSQPILMLATYRDDELKNNASLWDTILAMNRERLFHALPLEALGTSEVERLIASRFDESVAARLTASVYRKTEGNPFFVEEVLYLLQEQRLLYVSDTGWQVTDPDALETPESVKAVINQRMERLRKDTRELLRIASVVGRKFPLQLLTELAGQEEDSIVDALDEGNGANVVVPIQVVGEEIYSFVHDLTQETLYESIGPARRRRYHKRIGEAIEKLHADGLAEHYSELAHHYSLSDNVENAVHYRMLAGEQAIQRSAHEDAINHLTTALELLKTLPDTRERASRELTLQIALGIPLIATRGHGVPEVKNVYMRARELCLELGETSQVLAALPGLIRFYINQADLRAAREIGEQLMSLATREKDPTLILLAHRLLGIISGHMGEFAQALTWMEKARALYDVQRPHDFVTHAIDPKVQSLATSSLVLWKVGYPEKALASAEEAFSLAQKLSHPYTLVYATRDRMLLHQQRRELQATIGWADALISLCNEQSMPPFLAFAIIMRGWVLTQGGEFEEGLAQIHEGFAIRAATGSLLHHPYLLGLRAEAQGTAGQIEEGLNTFAEALHTVDETEEHRWESDLLRMRGELLAKSEIQGAQSEAESCLRRAAAVARQQGARSYELRAATSLSRLLRDQDRNDEARKMLAETYSWFTEGFDTADLKDAKALLDELS